MTSPVQPSTDGLRILAVDDDLTTRVTLRSIIRSAGWSPVMVEDPQEAYQILVGANAPPIALVDWQMPRLSGLDLCRRVRDAAPDARPYLILVTAKTAPADVVAGLDAGADGYMTKPVQAIELQARVRAGLRTIALQQDLRSRLREAEARGRSVRELLPICCYCRRIRDDDQQWSSLEDYLHVTANVRFSHGFCPDCYEHHVLPDLESLG